MDSYLKELAAALAALLAHLQTELGGVRSNRPSVQIVENVMVEYYGQKMPLQQVASLSIRPPRDIEINVWDKEAVAPAMKAIQEANIGLSVSNDGNIIRGSLPALTAERREEFMKLAKRIVEEAKIQIRMRRDETNKKVKAAEEEGALNEDQVFKGKEQIQKAVDEANKKAEALLEGKVKELSE